MSLDVGHADQPRLGGIEGPRQLADRTTCHVLVVGPPGLYREGAYVAMSRARHSARLYATVAQTIELDERHNPGIPLPTDTDHTPEHDLITRLTTSAAKTLVTITDPDTTIIDHLAGTHTPTELVALVRHAAAVEAATGLSDGTTATGDYERAVDLRRHITEGRRVRAIDRDNVGHILHIDDTAATVTVHFDNDRGRHATRTLAWHQLVAIDNPEPVQLTPDATTTLERLHTQATTAVENWRAALAAHGQAPDDATRYRQALHLALERATHQLHAEQPEWLTTWIGTRPATAAAGSVWDDTVTRIARYRALNNIHNHIPGLGPRPHPDAEPWDRLMLRILEDRCWLTAHPAPTPCPLRQRTPDELRDRRRELDTPAATAPPDQTELIQRLTDSTIHPAELHQHLLTAATAQDDRRQWIITNWPHLVELQQINQLIAALPAPRQRPARRPVEVDRFLQALADTAVPPDRREERTLAQITQAEADADPLRRLTTRLGELRRLAEDATPPELAAVNADIERLNDELHTVRRQQTIDRAFGAAATAPTTSRAPTASPPSTTTRSPNPHNG